MTAVTEKAETGMISSDTICAIATAPSEAAIGIVRISGPDALSIADRMIVNAKKNHILSEMESHTIRYGFLFNGEEILDEVLVSFFKAPKSFTAEDTVEINTHGGVFVLQKALELSLSAGARLAEPGEFTKRAFLNGRIDLTEAEAVMDVISADSEMALKSSVSVLRGSLYHEIKDLREKILHETAFIESALDDPEHFDLTGYPQKLSETVNNVSYRVSSLIYSYRSGRILKEGIKTVILGKPNVGKSSLLNLFAGFDRAIVTEIPGTTRDIVEEKIRFGDMTLDLIDTAGIRKTEDRIENIGIEKALSYAEEADLILYVADSSRAPDEEDKRITEFFKKNPRILKEKTILLYNKSDLKPEFSPEDLKKAFETDSDLPLIRISALSGEGLTELQKTIRKMFFEGKIDYNTEVMISNLRQKEALEQAFSSLSNVKKAIEDGMSEDFFTIDLTAAYESLGFVIGESLEDDLADKIFSEFCMGK